MKKQLFYMFMLFGSVFAVSAQNTCATAVPVTIGSTTVGTINGTYLGDCWATPGTFAEWYSYTATANGFYRINTNLPINDGIDYSSDSRISVFTGTCAALTCYAFADDIDENNYLTDFSFAVAQGQTYYIAFDDRWDDMTIVFEASFTPETCFPVIEGFNYAGTPSPTAVSIVWSPPAVGTPEGYEFEYGEVGFTQGEGTLLTPTTAQADLTELTPVTTYEFYIRTDCGEGDYSDWTGPVQFATPYEPATLPYSFGFEDTPQAGGWTAVTVLETGSPWEIMPEDPGVYDAYEGEQLAAAGAYGAPSDAWLFSRGFNLLEDEEITITYYIAKAALAGDGNVNNLEVTIGDDATVAAQTEVLGTFNDYSSLDYVQQTHTFTAPAAGVYYLGFNYTAPAHEQANFGFLLLDALNITSSLGVEDKSLSQLLIYPNPTSDFINITNNGNVLLNGVKITDLNGRIVKSTNLSSTSNAQINISDLSAGMYLMTISSESGTLTQKLVKE